MDGRDARGRERAGVRPVHPARPAAPRAAHRADRPDVRRGRRHAGRPAARRLPAPAGAPPADAGRAGRTTSRRSARRCCAGRCTRRRGSRGPDADEAAVGVRVVEPAGDRSRCTCRYRARSCGSSGGRSASGSGTAPCPATSSAARRRSRSSATRRATSGSSRRPISVPDRWWVRLAGPLTRGGAAAVPAAPGARRTADARPSGTCGLSVSAACRARPAGDRRTVPALPRRARGRQPRGCRCRTRARQGTARRRGADRSTSRTSRRGGRAVPVGVVGFPAGLLTREPAAAQQPGSGCTSLVFALVGAVLSVMLCARCVAAAGTRRLALVAAPRARSGPAVRGGGPGRAHARRQVRVDGRARTQRCHGEG